MARIEWVKLRLNNWALWKARDEGGGSGWSSQSSFLKEFSGGRYREAVVPVDEVDAATTNTAVESLRTGREHLYETLQCMYPRGMGATGTARELMVDRSTVNARLEQADAALAKWFRDRAEARKSFTT